MANKRFWAFLLSAAFLFAVLVSASFFLTAGNGEPENDYSKIIGEAEANGTGIGLFSYLEPARASYHIGDIIALRFGTVYSKDLWDISEKQFQENIALPDKFEVRSQKISSFYQQEFKVIEVVMNVQCLECRDEEYSLFPSRPGGIGLVARDKAADIVMPIALPVRQVRFSPLTKVADNVELGLISAPFKQPSGMRIYWRGLAALSFAAAVILFAYARRSTRVTASSASADADLRNIYIKAIEDLKEKKLNGAELRDVSHALYNLLVLLAQEYEDLDIRRIIDITKQSYSREGLRSQVLDGLIEDAIKRVTQRGEVG